MEQVHTRSFIEAIIAVLALWFMLWELPDFASTVYITLSGQEEIPLRMIRHHGVHLAGYALIGALLMIFRARLAGWLVPRDDSASFQPSAFIGVGTALVGVYFVASGITSLGEWFAAGQVPGGTAPYPLWRGIFACAIGIALFVFSVGIERVWHLLKGLRRAGI